MPVDSSTIVLIVVFGALIVGLSIKKVHDIGQRVGQFMADVGRFESGN